MTLTTLFAGCGGESSPTSPNSMGSPLTVLSGLYNGSGVQVRITGSPAADVNGAVLVQSTAGVFLLARTSASGFTAVDGTCTHEGCTVNSADGAAYVCPCHGSRYSRSGQVMAGPARSALRQYATTFANDVVTIAL